MAPIDPSTGNLILSNTDGTVTLLNESTRAQTEIPVADNTVNSVALGHRGRHRHRRYLRHGRGRPRP
jgi:hypothetical protein